MSIDGFRKAVLCSCKSAVWRPVADDEACEIAWQMWVRIFEVLVDAVGPSACADLAEFQNREEFWKAVYEFTE